MRKFSWVALVLWLCWGSSLLIGCSGPANKMAAVNDDEFRKALDDCYDNAATRRLNVKEHAAWQVIHGALAFGNDYLIAVDGQDVKAVNYLLNGGMMKGWELGPGEKGVIAKVDPGSVTGQGHPDQWIGYLSQIGIKAEDKLVVGEKAFTFNDLLTQAKWTISDDPQEQETVAWSLMAFTVYLPLDAKWKNSKGEDWSIERIVGVAANENNGHPYEGACNGAHRLYALAKAVARYKQEHNNPAELPGPWKLAGQRVQQAIQDAKNNQNGDGSYSPSYFLRAGSSPDPVDRIRAGGHVLEFLSVALTDEQLREPWVTRGMLTLTNLFQKTKGIDIECGALYHASNAIKNYRERRFGPRGPATAVAAKSDN